MRPQTRIFLRLPLAAALILPACNVGPNYHPPEIPIEESFGHSIDNQSEAWWTSFRDSALNDLIQTASQNSLNLQLAAARIREARAQFAAVAGNEAPTLNADAAYQHDRFSQNAAPFNAFNVPNFPWEYNLYQPGFDASWEIDVFGGTRRAIEAAHDTLQATEENRRAVIVSLLAEVARNYIELRGEQDRRTIAQNNLDVQQQTLELTRDLMTNGMGTQLDVARAQAQVAQTAALIPAYEQAEWQILHRLAVLTNQPLEKLLPLRTVKPLPASTAEIMVGVPADLLRRRPDIRRAERQLAAATAKVGIATADLYPKFSLTGYFNLQSASVEDLFNWKSRAFSFGPTITWPIFEGGRLRALVAVQNAQEQEALITYEQTIQDSIAEVRDQMIAIVTDRQRQTALAQAVASDQQAVDLSRQLYRQGLADFLSVLDAQRQLLDAQDALSQAKTEETAALIALYKALGGAWDVPDKATSATLPATMPASATAASPPGSNPAKEPKP